jgi:hypothetical protein
VGLRRGSPDEAAAVWLSFVHGGPVLAMVHGW